MSDAIEAWLPGQTITAERLNADRMIGSVVFSARRAATQSIPETTGGGMPNTPVVWDDIELDHLNGWDAGDPSVYTVMMNGWYELTGSASFVTIGGESGFRLQQFMRNGTPVPGTFSRQHAVVNGNGGRQTLPRPRMLNLVVGDEIQLNVGQTTTAALNLTADSPASTCMSIKFVTPPAV